MGKPFLLSSRGSQVVIDRHPDFDSRLIDKELVRREKKAVREFVSSLRTIMEAMIVKPEQAGETVAFVEDPDAEPAKPYALLRDLMETLKPKLPEELYKQNVQFLKAREIESEEAKIAKKTENHLERSEVG